MTVEVATYISDLQPSNPAGTDPRSEGDNHLRLIKQVLQNTFGGTTRLFQIPSTRSYSASTPVAKTDGESTVYVSTSGGSVTLTLPTLVAADAGWKISIIKTSSDANPCFVAPPSGTINSGGVAGLSKARRAIPGIANQVVWDGSSWFITRSIGLPIGSCIEYHGSALPAGYEWPSGQTLSSAANYPEYNSVTGGLTTLDKRGRIGVPLDNLGGSAAGRWAGGIITATAIGNSGGSDVVTLSTTQIPSHQHAVFLKDPTHTHTINNGTNIYTANVAGNLAGGSGAGTYNLTNAAAATGITIGSVSGTANDNQTATTGGGAAHSNVQPSIIVAQILVVE